MIRDSLCGVAVVEASGDVFRVSAATMPTSVSASQAGCSLGWCWSVPEHGVDLVQQGLIREETAQVLEHQIKRERHVGIAIV